MYTHVLKFCIACFLESFKELYSQAIDNLGSEKLQLCKVVFFGPPGVGKSSLLRVLLKDPELKRDSTGVFDLKLVRFKVVVTKDEKESKSIWNVVTLTKEIERLCFVIERKLNKKNAPNEVEHGIEKLGKKQQPLEQPSLPNVDKDINIHEVICQSFQDSSTKEQSIHRTSNIIMALYDSGGQPEFVDVMPLLNTMPTGNVMIFNMNESLDAKIKPQLYKKGDLVSTGAETHYTNAELMKTALANIESCIAVQKLLPCTKILVVGTHLDNYKKDKENVDESLSQLDDTLNKRVLSDATRDMLVYYKRKDKADRIVHPISNAVHNKEQDEVSQTIRTAVEELSKVANIHEEIPNSWLLFQYQIMLLKKPCIKVSDCQDIAKEICYMEEDVKVVLKYFHDHGLLLNYKEVDDVVFCDPQWLFEQVSAIIKAKYSKAFRPHIENGIINKTFMANKIYFNLEKETDGVMKLNDLLKLFVSLNVMAKLPIKHSKKQSEKQTEEQYFMPALLDPAPQDLSLLEFGKKFYDTMYVMCRDTLFPRGVFCCLVTLLTQDQKVFKFMESQQCMYKNLIIFQITDENENYLVLCDKINYMTVEVYQQNQYNLLQKIHCELLDALQKVCERMKSDYQFEFGFACQEKICQEKNHKENTTTVAIVELEHNYCPEIMCCKGCGKHVPLKYHQLLWFIPSKALSVLKAEVRFIHEVIKNLHNVNICIAIATLNIFHKSYCFVIPGI